MTDHDTAPTKPSEIWGTIWPVVLILVVTTVAWFLLSYVALHAHEKDSAQVPKWPTTVDYDKATTWATDILGLAAILAGFLGITAAARQSLRLTSPQRPESAVGGIAGILAGATLLDVGGWPASVGLAAVATGVAVRLIHTSRAPDCPPDKTS